MRYRTGYTCKLMFLALKKYGVLRRWQSPNANLNNVSGFFWKKIAIFVSLKITHFDFSKQILKKIAYRKC